MSGTKQIGLSAFGPQRPPEKPLSERITEFLKGQGGHRWQGTAHDLAQVLNTCVSSPRALSVKLKRSTDELKRAGVHVTHKQIKGAHIIVLSLAHRVAQAVRLPGETEERPGCSKIDAEPEPITFPFSWPFAQVTELTPEEQRDKNAWQINGRMRTRRPCSLCGCRGSLEFVKTAPGSARTYLCRSCAEDYVRKARRVIQQLGGDNHEEVPTK